MFLRHARAAHAAAILFLPVLAGVVGGELGPASGEPHIWDKALHFIAYFILATLAAIALSSWKRIGLAMLGLVAMGGTLEIVQGMIGRDMSVRDELANSLGVVTAAAVAWVLRTLLVRLGGAD